MGQQQDRRQEHRAEGIDVLCRIEADAAEVPGGIVAEAMGDKGVGGLMKGNGEDQRQDPDRNVVNGEVQWMSCLAPGKGRLSRIFRAIFLILSSPRTQGPIRRGFSF